MSQQLATILAASIAAGAAVIGWMVTHWLTDTRERRKQRLEAALRYTERQLEELYGPLAFLRLVGSQTFRDLLASLGRHYVFRAGEPLTADDRRTWLFWVENDLLPRNEKMKKLLAEKTHLIEGGRVPDSFLRFLDHHNSWSINHQRWKQEGVEYPLRSKINFPSGFNDDILSTFELLKARHAAYLQLLTPDNRAPGRAAQRIV